MNSPAQNSEGVSSPQSVVSSDDSSSMVAANDLERTLEQVFGLQEFRPGQEAVIRRLLQARSAVAIFPTGGGKSLCYQLPAILLEGLTLVVSPLLALMREQVEQLNGRGIGAARLDSTLSVQEGREVMQGVRSGKVKLLYVAPERFFNERFRQFISDQRISLFAIDEAHCISQWGHNFRPDYLKLARLARELQVGRVLALTATATPAVLDDIRREFTISPEDAIQTQFYRSNLALRFTLCTPETRKQILLERLRSQAAQTSIVYVSLQKTSEEIARLLCDSGISARPYHAGLSDEVRQETQDWFMSSDAATVVATIAFGMGIDKSNIRAVYHYNASKSIENYAQEIGRAGRDGQPARCESLVVPEDRVVLENFAYGDTPSLASLKKFVDFLAGQPEKFFVSYYALAQETDIRDLVIRTLLTNLELNDLLEALAPRYETYRFKPSVASTEILGNFEGERRVFAASVLSMSVKKSIWFEIPLAQAADRLGCERARIVAMLDYFAEQGWMELKASGLVHGYRRLKKIDDLESLARQLHDYVLDREIGELSRLNELFELMCSATCQSAGLSAHFGQPLQTPCGHCSACCQEAIEELPKPNYPRVGDSALRGVRQLRKKHPQALDSPRQQARFLCGLSSPQQSRARLSREPLYGCCSGIPFDRVVDALMD